MKENKNIERLFQEKFKDFEAMPPANAWGNIAERLNEKKKKRRVIPFWFKTTGIAASLLLASLIGFTIYNNNKSNTDFEKEDLNTKVTTVETKKQNKVATTKNDVATTNNEVVIIIDTINQVESNLKSINNKKSISDDIKNKSKFYSNKNLFTENSNNSKKTNEFIASKNIDENAFDNKLIESIKNTDKIFENELITNNNNTTKNDFKNLKNELKSVKDSSLVAKISEEVAALEQLLKENEEGLNADEKEKEKRNKWGVMSNVAPVYFNSLTNGSPLGNQFVENEKSFKPSISYGVGVGYEITNKLNLRTGVNNLMFEYDTKNVFYSSTFNAVINDNTNLSRNSNGNGISFNTNTKVSELSADIENVTINSKGTLNQQISFIEMPLELSYKLIESKFSVDVIGGFSSLFLNQNSVSLISNGMSMEIGEASNLNNIHFSGNLGLGIKYNFLKSLEASFNPMIKHQINTYKNNSGNFKPYFIGLYSGITYKF